MKNNNHVFLEDEQANDFNDKLWNGESPGSGFIPSNEDLNDMNMDLTPE